jgi:hypothetical protein
MNIRLTYGACVIFGVLSLVLLIANVALVNSNRHTQDSANQRQADINKGTSLAQLNQGLIQALAEAAVNNNDTAVKDLLAAQGITINPANTAGSKPKAEAAPPTPAPAPARRLVKKK